jgi:Flp pilus assembly protein CpaB
LRRRWFPRWIRRHRWLYWLGCVALAGITAHAISSAAGSAEAARAAWGQAHPVLVARHRLEIGHVLDAEDVAPDSWPAAIVPRGAVPAADSAVGRTVVDEIEPGEAVLAGRLAPDGLQGVAALVPLGWRALAIPAGPSALPLAVGDRVDLVAAVDGTDATASESPSFVLADNALVVAVHDQSVTVAVRADDAPRVALAIVTGSVVPALRSG